MLETLLPLKIPPGFVNNGTKYLAKGRWYTGSLVRFRPTLQPIGGWVVRTLVSGSVSGVPRAAIRSRFDDFNASFPASATADFVAVATTTGLYVVYEGVGPGASSAGLIGSVTATTWQLEAFGKYIIAVASGFVIYTWDTTTGTLALAAPGGAFGSSGPRLAHAAVTTPERFLMMLGTGAGASPGSSDRTIMWPSQESVTDWVPSATNTAGQIQLATAGSFIAGKAARGETLLFSTADLWRAVYIGGTFVYSFSKAGDACGIVSANAAAMVDTTAFWMGNRKFFRYNGSVQAIPCDVEDYVFTNINLSVSSKIWALANPQFGEVTWHYASANATEIDSYVTYNYEQDLWTFGALVRTAGITQQFGIAATGPVMFDASGVMYDHETGSAHSGSTPFVESGPVELGDGDTVMRVQRVVPDDKTAGDVTVSVYTSMYPDAAETLNGPYALASPTNVRLTARQVRIRITEAIANAWRVGVVRLGVIPGGRR